MRIDGHWDTALFLRDHDSLEHLPEAHCDWRRLREFVDVAVTAIFVHPLEYRGERQYQEFWALAEKLLADLADPAHGISLLLRAEQLQQEPPAKLALLGAEGGGFLGADHGLERLEEAFQQGLRLLGLTWNYANDLAGGCFEGGGLSPLGKQVVKACNQRGIVLDGAHLSAESLSDLLSVSESPFVVSHTACAALSPQWKVRNLLDWQLKAVAEAGGVVGICFVPDFIGGTPSMARVAQHIAYAAQLIGCDHVGVGSDFDGTELPADIEGLQSLPRLEQELKLLGFHDGEIAQIMGENFCRLLRRTLP